MKNKVENLSVDLLSKATKIVETTYTDHVDGLLSIGFKLIAIVPQNDLGSDNNPFVYSLMWDGILKDGVDPKEFRRVNRCWPFLSDRELFEFLRNEGL